MRQASHRKMIQSLALRLRLWLCHIKIFSAYKLQNLFNLIIQSFGDLKTQFGQQRIGYASAYHRFALAIDHPLAWNPFSKLDVEIYMTIVPLMMMMQWNQLHRNQIERQKQEFSFNSLSPAFIIRNMMCCLS